MTEYPAKVTLSNPVAGAYTKIVEDQSGPHGHSFSFTLPSQSLNASSSSGTSTAAARQAQTAAQAVAAAAAQAQAAREQQAAGVAKCTQSGVNITTAQGPASAGHFTQLVSVRNTGPKSCALPTYPLLTFHTAGSQSVYTAGPTPASPANPAPVPVVLALEETATASFGGGDNPIGTETVCPTFDSYTVNIAEGTPATFHSAVSNCAGVMADPFVAGFNGVAPPTGRVVGHVPECKAGPASGPGPTVSLNFAIGRKVVSPEFVFASTKASERFHFDLAPATYRLTSSHGSSRQVRVRVGQTTQIGRFGVCGSSPTTATTLVGGAPATTSTLTTAPAVASSAAVCTAGHLTAQYRGSQGEAGNLVSGFWIANTGPTPCQLSGTVSVELLDGHGASRTATHGVTPSIVLSASGSIPPPGQNAAKGATLASLVVGWLTTPNAVLSLGGSGVTCPEPLFQATSAHITFPGVQPLIVDDLTTSMPPLMEIPAMCGSDMFVQEIGPLTAP